MWKKKRWNDLTGAQRVTTVLLITIQLALLAAALWDIRQRSPEEIRGHKQVWTGVVFVNFVGPIAYFLLARKGRVLQ